MVDVRVMVWDLMVSAKVKVRVGVRVSAGVQTLGLWFGILWELGLVLAFGSGLASELVRRVG